MSASTSSSLPLEGEGGAILGEPQPMSPPPLRRPIEVEETAAAAVFLASAAASGMKLPYCTLPSGDVITDSQNILRHLVDHEGLALPVGPHDVLRAG